MKGYRTYLAGLLAALMGFALLLVGHFHPPDVVDKVVSLGMIAAGLAAMGVRGFMGAKTGN